MNHRERITKNGVQARLWQKEISEYFSTEALLAEGFMRVGVSHIIFQRLFDYQITKPADGFRAMIVTPY